MSYNHYLYLVTTYFHTPRRKLVPISSPSSPWKPLLHFLSMDLPILISHTNGILQHDLLCLSSFTQPHVFKVRPHGSVCQCFISFYGRIIFHGMYPHLVLTNLLHDSDTDTKVWEPPQSSLALWFTFLTGLYILQHRDLFPSVLPPLSTVSTTRVVLYTLPECTRQRSQPYAISLIPHW